MSNTRVVFSYDQGATRYVALPPSHTHDLMVSKYLLASLHLASFGPILVIANPSCYVKGPALAFVGRRWVLWAFVGLRWPSVGCCGPALAFRGVLWAWAFRGLLPFFFVFPALLLVWCEVWLVV